MSQLEGGVMIAGAGLSLVVNATVLRVLGGIRDDIHLNDIAIFTRATFSPTWA